MVYKPKPLGLEAAFQQLLAWINERGFEPPFRQAVVIDRGVFGWMEMLHTAACEDDAALRRRASDALRPGDTLPAVAQRAGPSGRRRRARRTAPRDCAAHDTDAFLEQLDAFAGSETRLLFRNTMQYSTVLLESFHPHALGNALERDRNLTH